MSVPSFVRRDFIFITFIWNFFHFNFIQVLPSDSAPIKKDSVSESETAMAQQPYVNFQHSLLLFILNSLLVLMFRGSLAHSLFLKKPWLDTIGK